MGFQQGLSGLSVASTNLDVIGNNIANSNTVGFKDGRAEFADLFANSLSTGVNNSVGLGARVSQVAQSFTEGSLTTTTNPLDTAINGEGFFRVSNNGSISYSRDGQFQVNANGNLINSTGAQVTGYAANGSGVIQAGSPAPLVINTAPIAPQATSKITQVANLDAADATPANPVFSPTDQTSWNYHNQQQVYDSLGDAHNLVTYYQLQPTGGGVPANTWNVYATMDGQPVTVTNGVSVTDASGNVTGNAALQIQFSATGAIAASTPATLPAQFSYSGLSNGATTPFNIDFDPTGSTATSNTGDAISSQTQDGFASGTLSSFAIGLDGTINGNYSNGQTKALGQLVLANFTDPNGLQPTGDNAWLQTSASGQPIIGTPESGSFGKLQSSTLEASNVDLTSSLVDLITAQRTYQANAQTIKAQDTILQTIITGL